MSVNNKGALEQIAVELKKAHVELKFLSKKTGIKMKELIPMITNRQLMIIHQHMDIVEKQESEEKAKKKEEKPDESG